MIYSQKKVMAAANLIGGPAVLGSYVWGTRACSSQTVDRLWGEVPETIRPYSTGRPPRATQHMPVIATDTTLGHDRGFLVGGSR